jgi:hypothetical protein
MTGRKTFVTCHGYVMPCCWLEIPRYDSDGKVRNEDWELVENIFLRKSFHLETKSYREIVSSDEWLMALEQLFVLKYHPCKMKCNNFFVHEGKITHDEIVIDDMVLNGEVNTSKDMSVFNQHLVDTWDVNEIQVELTNRCSLKCSYCPRTVEKLHNSDLPIACIEDVLMSKKWDIVDDVGSYGDSIFYRHYHEFLKILAKADVVSYFAHFAATGRNKAWWDKTIDLFDAVVKSGTRIKILFGIDGLEDTSKMHRIGQDWNEITHAMRRTKEVGCDPIWQFIPMRFNEHQIDEAARLAKEWNVKFRIHTSCRFRKDDPNTPTDPKYHRNFYDVR